MPLADNISLPLPTHSGDVGDIYRIAAALVIHVGQKRIQVIGFRIQLVSDGDVEGLIG